MPQDAKDLKLTQAEFDRLGSVLSPIQGFGKDNCCKQVGPDEFMFLPEAISGTDGRADAVLELARAAIAGNPT